MSRAAELASRFVDTSLGWHRAGLWVEGIALALDSYRFPGLLLFLGVCLTFLPLRLAARREAPERDGATARRVDQALLSGAERGRARRLAIRGAKALPFRTMLLWAALAATSITPALVLAPTVESRPVGPGIVILAEQPGDSRAQAAALALAAIALDLAALSWASARGGRANGLEAADLA